MNPVRVSAVVAFAAVVAALFLVSGWPSDSRAERPRVVTVAPPRAKVPATAPVVAPAPGISAPAVIVVQAGEPVPAVVPIVETPPPVQPVQTPPAVEDPLVADPLIVSGPVVGVGDLRRMSMMVDGAGTVFTIEPNAEITLDGRPATLDQLRPGMRAQATMSDADRSRLVAVRATTLGRGCRVGHAAAPRPFIGVRMDRNSPGVGVQVLNVIDNSPAEAANLYIGDRILEIDDVAMTDSQQVVTYVRTRRPGDVVSVEVLRGDERVTVPVTLAAQPVRHDPYRGLSCVCGCGGYFGAPGGVVGAPQDIANLAAQQQELLRQNRELERLLEQLRLEMRQLRTDLTRTALR